MAQLPPLTVRTLGAFEVARAGAALPRSAWGREKALELFQYLVTHPSELIHRARACEELWPEQNAERAERDFKVALSALETALEPERAPRTPSGYLRRQGASYGLEPAAPVEIDYALLEREALEASRAAEAAAIDLYRRALARYRGDYLPETLAKDWAAATRERLQSLYLTSATHLARLLTARGATVEATLWCRRVIDLDPLWEEAYRILMAAHLQSGNRPQAVKAYRALERHLAESLGLAPMPETRALYERALEPGETSVQPGRNRRALE